MEMPWVLAVLCAACLAVLGLRAWKRRDVGVAAPPAPEPAADLAEPESVRLSDDQVKDRLRTAVAMDVIYGWYTHIPVRGKKWVVNPIVGPCQSYTDVEIREFCAMLDEAFDAATPE